MRRLNSVLAEAAWGEEGEEEAGWGEDEDGVGLVCLGVLVGMLREGEWGVGGEVLLAETAGGLPRN